MFQFEKLSNELLTPVVDRRRRAQAIGGARRTRPSRPHPSRAAPAAASASAGGLANSQRKDRRLMAMFFDMTTMPQFDQIRAQENAIKFIKEQMTSSDLVQIMVYGNKLNVVEEFTDDREKLLADLKSLVIGRGLRAGRRGGHSGRRRRRQRRLHAGRHRVQYLQHGPPARRYRGRGQDAGRLPREESDDLLLQRHSEERNRQSKPAPGHHQRGGPRERLHLFGGFARLGGFRPGRRRHSAVLARHRHIQRHAVRLRRISSQQDTQETIATLAADTGGKVMLDNNDLTMGFKAAQSDLSSYYILGYYSNNVAEDGKYRHIKVRLTNAQLASSTKPLEYKEGYYANKVFQKFTAADKEQQLQEALTLGDPLSDLPLVLEADYFRVAQNRYFVPISVKIPGSEVALAKTRALETTDFDFVGVVKSADGKSLGQLPQWATIGVRDDIKIELKGKDAAQLEKRNLQYDTGLTLPPGKYLIRFLARENQTGKMGTFETPFTIPDLSAEKALRISSVIYEQPEGPVAAAVGSAVNDKKALTNHPLIQDGQKMVPSITRVFRKDQTMYVYFEVYDPSSDEQKTPNVVAEVDLYAGSAQGLHLRADGREEAERGPAGHGALQFPDSLGEDSHGTVHRAGLRHRRDGEEVRVPAQRDYHPAGADGSGGCACGRGRSA